MVQIICCGLCAAGGGWLAGQVWFVNHLVWWPARGADGQIGQQAPLLMLLKSDAVHCTLPVTVLSTCLVYVISCKYKDKSFTSIFLIKLISDIMVFFFFFLG